MGNTTRIFVAGIVLGLLAGLGPFAQAEGGGSASGLSPAKGPIDLGLIFNTDDILLGLESYQAGIGAKIGSGKIAVRCLVDFTANKGSSLFAFDIGATLEYHFLSGPVSPYLGVSLGGGYMTQADVSSAVNFSIGVLAGIEVFLFDFLSVFAEYAIEADFVNTTDSQISQSTFDYLFNTRMGNGGKIGIVVYFMRSGKEK